MSYDFNRFRLLMSLALAGSTAALAGCGDTGADCGAGTTEVDGVCIPNDMVCAAGTVFDMTTLTCVPESTTTCGMGTILVDGMCVPESDITCARGTVLVDGECVLDGSVVCGPNTRFNTETGICEPDPESICEGDLVFVEASATCVDPDELLEGMADVLELGEINDPAFNEGAMPQVVDIADGDGSFYGCIEPQDFDEDGSIDADLDYFQISVDGPTLLNVRADGIRGLSAAVAFFATDDDLLDAGWQRVIGSLSGVSSNGQVFLPEAGDYFVAASDTRSLLLADVVAGGPDQCYFVQLSTEELPSPTTIDEAPTAGTFGNPQFFTTPTEDGDLVFVEMAETDEDGDLEDSSAVESAVVVVVNGNFVGQSGLAIDPFTGAAVGPAIVAASSLREDDEVIIVVDSVLNISADTVDFSVNATKPTIQDMPDDGTITFTQNIVDGEPEEFWVSFDATEGDVVHLVTDQPDGSELSWTVRSTTFDGYSFGGPGRDDYLQITGTGTHYISLIADDCVRDAFTGECTGPLLIAQDEEFDVYFAQTHITPTALTIGTAAAGDLTTEERAFFSIDLTTNDWVEFALSSLVNMTDGEVNGYDRTVFGPIDSGLLPPAPELDSRVTDSAFESILLGNGQNLLVSVEDDAGHDMDETLELTVRDVAYMDVGAVDSMTPQMAAGVALAADDVSRFVFQGTVPGENVMLTGSSATLDLVLDILDIPDAGVDTSVNDGAATEDETFASVVGSDGLTVAFRVRDAAGTAGTFDINLTADPAPYTSAAAALTFTSVCMSQGGSGTNIDFSGGLDDDVSAVLTLEDSGAFPFNFFGNPRTDFHVSTNGWMTFEADADLGSSFLGGGNVDVIAPFSDDLVLDEACWERNADLFTVEWRGATYGSAIAIEFQAILHTDGSIDFVYGPGHAATLGADDFAGLYNTDGSVQLPLTGTPTASTSFTWTEAP